MRALLLWGLAIALWVGSIRGWFAVAEADVAMQALGPLPSNAEVYPIENKLLLGFSSGIVLSFLAMIVTWVAGRGSRRR